MLVNILMQQCQRKHASDLCLWQQQTGILVFVLVDLLAIVHCTPHERCKHAGAHIRAYELAAAQQLWTWWHKHSSDALPCLSA